MDFTLSQDQMALRDAVSRFFMTEAAPELLREIWETDAGRSPDMRRKIAEQGLTALSVPTECGGLGLGDVDWSLMTQELGYYAIPDSLADTACVAVGVLNAARPRSDTWLQQVAEGQARVAVGHAVNPWVADAALADVLLLAHEGGQGLEIHAVVRDEVEVQPLASIDPSRRLARLEWAPKPETCLLLGERAEAAWAQALNRGALNVAGQLIGLAQRMLDMSTDYVAQRKQFGKPIGSFQAVKHHLADVVTRIEFARPVLYRAAHALDRVEAHADVLVSHAKLAAADAAWFAARQGIQVHGAMGYTWEVDLQMFMKRAWVLSASWGDQGFHKQRLAQALLTQPGLLGPGALLTELDHG